MQATCLSTMWGVCERVPARVPRVHAGEWAGRDDRLEEAQGPGSDSHVASYPCAGGGVDGQALAPPRDDRGPVPARGDERDPEVEEWLKGRNRAGHAPSDSNFTSPTATWK